MQVGSVAIKMVSGHSELFMKTGRKEEDNPVAIL